MTFPVIDHSQEGELWSGNRGFCEELRRRVRSEEGLSGGRTAGGSGCHRRGSRAWCRAGSWRGRRSVAGVVAPVAWLPRPPPAPVGRQRSRDEAVRIGHGTAPAPGQPTPDMTVK